MCQKNIHSFNIFVLFHKKSQRQIQGVNLVIPNWHRHRGTRGMELYHISTDVFRHVKILSNISTYTAKPFIPPYTNFTPDQ